VRQRVVERNTSLSLRTTGPASQQTNRPCQGFQLHLKQGSLPPVVFLSRSRNLPLLAAMALSPMQIIGASENHQAIKNPPERVLCYQDHSNILSAAQSWPMADHP